MPCEHVRLPGGGTAIVCSKGRTRKCVQCGGRADRLCDWKVEQMSPGGEWLTCDKPLCRRCTYVPAADKDLCPAHAAAWKERLAAREGAR